MSKIDRRSALALMGSAALASPLVAQTSPAKLAFVMGGKPAEIGWNFEHQRGVEMVKKEFGDRVQIETLYGVAEWGKNDGEDAKVFKALADQNFDLVFACSSGYMNSVVQVSLGSQHTNFEHCGGYIRANHLSTYTARWYEGRVIEGILAGNMTKTNKIGYIASFPLAQIIRGINSAFLAARSVNPDVEMEVVWVNSWFDPAKEEAAARELASRGVDVFFTHANTPKHVEVAEELGLSALGKASDMAPYGPNSVLTSTMNNWGPYYIKRTQAILDGTWESTETWGGLAEEMIAIAPFNENLPRRVALQAKDTLEKMTAGKAHAFTGPISRQNKTGWLAAGEDASDSDLLTMDFFVDGISSIIPNR